MRGFAEHAGDASRESRQSFSVFRGLPGAGKNEHIRRRRIQATRTTAFPINRRRKTILILLAIAAIIGGVVWWALPGEPRIELVEFRDGNRSRVAVFRFVNDSPFPRAFASTKSGRAKLQYRIETPDGWKGPGESTWYWNVPTGHYTVIRPYSTATITQPIHSDLLGSRFMIGTEFRPCDLAGNINKTEGPIRRITNWLRSLIGKPPVTIETTWSEPVRDAAPGAAE